MDWVAQSSDLNPIENLWQRKVLDILKRRQTTKRELIESLITACNSVVNNDHLLTLVPVLPTRLLHEGGEERALTNEPQTFRVTHKTASFVYIRHKYYDRRSLRS